MRLCWLRRPLQLGLLGLVLAAPAYAQPPSPFVPGPWWKDFQKTLALTPDQSTRLEAVFQSALPHLRHKRDELERQEEELSRLIQADADDTTIAKQSDRVEAVRTVLNKSRTLMLVHMRAILTPEQRTRLTTIREQWDKEHHSQQPRTGAQNAPR